MDLEKNPDVVVRGCHGMTNAACIYNKSDIERCGHRGGTKGYIRFRREANQKEARQT